MPSVARMTRDVLDRPLGTSPLNKLASGVRRVVVIVDDLTRHDLRGLGSPFEFLVKPLDDICGPERNPFLLFSGRV